MCAGGDLDDPSNRNSGKVEEHYAHSLSINLDLVKIAFSVERRCAACCEFESFGALELSLGASRGLKKSQEKVRFLCCFKGMHLTFS